MMLKNRNIEIMNLEDGDLVAFDPETGDTHFLNEVASDILRLLEAPLEFDALITALAREYDAEPEVIAADVKPFLDELCEKHILIEQ